MTKKSEKFERLSPGVLARPSTLMLFGGDTCYRDCSYLVKNEKQKKLSKVVMVLSCLNTYDVFAGVVLVLTPDEIFWSYEDDFVAYEHE